MGFPGSFNELINVSYLEMGLYSDRYFNVNYYYFSSPFLIHCVIACRSLANLVAAHSYSHYSLLPAAGTHFGSAGPIGAISK